MATDISPTMLAAHGWRRQPLNRARVAAHRPIAAARRLRRMAVTPPAIVAAPVQISDRFEGAGTEYREQDWSFVDGFFDVEGHRSIVDGWPARSFFSPMDNPLKTYDFGFRYTRSAGMPAGIERWPAMAAAYAELTSPAFCDRVTALCGDGVPRTADFVVSTWATSGSSLIAHRDSFVEGAGAGNLNIVIFIDGTGGPDAGGTAIIADGDFEHTVFEPTKLTNTALVYRQLAPLWHGFRPMRRNTWRWTINAEYSPPGD